MLRNLFDIGKFETLIRCDAIDRPVRLTEPDRPMSAPRALEGLIVVAGNPSDRLKAFVLDRIDPSA
jgi:hypothetical protein